MRFSTAGPNPVAAIACNELPIRPAVAEVVGLSVDVQDSLIQRIALIRIFRSGNKKVKDQTTIYYETEFLILFKYIKEKWV
jgi:hypothetical protein